MHRNLLLSQLNTYRTSPTLLDPEDLTITQFENFIQKNPLCFERTLEEGHLTASCWLWNKERTACLFTLHKKLKKWLQLGGHADGDSDLLQVALKEAKEESGIEALEVLSEEIFDLSIHEIPTNSKEKAHLHYDVRFLLRATTNTPFVISSESDDLKWIRLDDFNQYELDPSILRMRTKISFLLSKNL